MFKELLEKLRKNPNYQPANDVEKALLPEALEVLEKEKTASEDASIAKMGDAIAAAVSKALGDAGIKAGAKPDFGGANANVDADYKALKGDSKIKKFFETVDYKNMSELQAMARDMDAKERAVAFFKAVGSRNLVAVKALSEGSDTDGGHLVPEEFRMEIIREMKDLPVIRSRASVFPMSTKTLELPKLTADVAVYWGTENVAMSTTSADFGNLVLTAYRLNAILYTSRELVADAGVGVVSLITSLFAEAIGRAEDKAFATGSGSGQPTGLTQASINGIDAGGAVGVSHINALYWNLGQRYRDRATWLANGRTIANLTGLKDSTGRLLIQEADQGGLPTLKGRPVLEQNDLPSSKIYFGDLKLYYIGDREQMSVETSTEEGDTFKKHQLAIKVVERIDGKVALTQAFRVISNTGVS